MKRTQKWLQLPEKLTTHFHWVIFGCYFFLAVLVMWPQIQQKFPALVDDGEDLLMAKQLSTIQLVKTEFLEQQRTWPLRMQYRNVLYELFGVQVGWHFGAYSLVLLGILWLTREILVVLKIPPWVANSAPLFLLTFPSLYGSLYRLGPTESIQTLFLLGGLFLLFRHHIGWAVGLFCLNLLNKETSIFYIVPLFLYLWQTKKRTWLIGAGIVLAAFILLLWYKLAHVSGSYVERSHLSWWFIANGLDYRSWTFTLLLLNFIFLPFATKSNLVKDSLLLAYLSTFIPYFIWNFGIQYYYQLPNHVLGFICLVFLMVEGWERPKIIWWRAVYGFVVLMLSWQLYTLLIPHSVATISHWQKEYAIGGKLVGYLLDKNLDKSILYIGVHDFERHDKVQAYATVWKERSIPVFPTYAEWKADENDPAKLAEQATEVTKQFLLEQNPDKVLITDQNLPVLPDDLAVYPICDEKRSYRRDCWYYLFYPKDSIHKPEAGK